MGVLALLSMPAMASEPLGFVYQSTTHQLLGSGSVAPAKVGTATCTQYFGVVALGNCSIKQAMTNGNIKALSLTKKQKIFSDIKKLQQEHSVNNQCFKQ